MNDAARAAAQPPQRLVRWGELHRNGSGLVQPAMIPPPDSAAVHAAAAYVTAVRRQVQAECHLLQARVASQGIGWPVCDGGRRRPARAAQPEGAAERHAADDVARVAARVAAELQLLHRLLRRWERTPPCSATRRAKPLHVEDAFYG